MKLANDFELDNTRSKLRVLQESYDELSKEAGDDEEMRQASMESLARLINQFREEIARYEAGHLTPDHASSS